MTHESVSQRVRHESAKRVSRREAIGMLGVAGAALSIGCNGESPTSPTSITTTTTTTITPPTGASSTCALSPTETIGPYPSLTDLIRSDIREGRRGLQVTLAITVVNFTSACAPVSGAVVEVWQCDANGDYSQYGTARAETFLRGIQTTDASGRVTFTTVYPGWYQGRATHIHVEVTVNGRSVKVTQIAFPENVTAAVYGTGVYAARGQNPTTNARDGIFADSLSEELATLVGDTTNGYTATYQLGVAM